MVFPGEGCPPSGLKLVWTNNSVDATSVNFEWKRVAPGVPAAGGTWNSVSLTGSATSYVLPSVIAGWQYNFRVRECNAAGGSPNSNSVFDIPR